jgi:hypothetical protein
VERPKGVCIEKGDLIHWVVQVEDKRDGGLGWMEKN